MKLWLISGVAVAIAAIAAVLFVRHQTESKRSARNPAVAKARQTEATNQPVPAPIPAAAPVTEPVPNATPIALPAALEPKPARTFPPVKLQGIAYRKERPSALINGKTMFVAEHVGEAKIIAIDPSSVTLEIEGEFRVYVLGK